MRNEFVTLNQVQTHIITYGKPCDCDGTDVIICITGNPGITDFYKEFAAKLHLATGMPLCVIGHAGHEVVPDKKSNILEGQEHLFHLNGQLKHKLELINNYIDKQSKLHLIGHSIGAWLILELLRDNENLSMRLNSINLLFPTLQKMAETRNVKVLPTAIVAFIVEIYLKLHSIPLHYSKYINKFLDPKVGEKVLFLAYDEMDSVRNLNMEVIAKNKHLINIIYSNRDNWSPVSYMEELHKLQPEIPMKKVDIDHAFVLKSSEKVAEIVAQFINM